MHKRQPPSGFPPGYSPSSTPRTKSNNNLHPHALPVPRENVKISRSRHPWLRINRVLRVMLHARWSAEAWAEVRVEFRRALPKLLS
jgi:hypothetical protein